MKPVRLPASATLALPRWGLVALCLLYILPGLIRRDPWKSDDAAGFGIMWTMARGGWQDWLLPHIAGLPVPGGPIVWSTTGPPPSTFVQIPGLLSSRCVNDGPRGYLSVRVNADPSDARTDRIGGEVGALGFFLPGWGMHLMDLAGPMDDLVARVAALNPPRSGTALPPARPVPPPA